MSRAVEELYEQASHLSEEDRAELAGKLLESIEDPPDAGVEEAWRRKSNEEWSSTERAG
jgi:hypothetical protein